jgi:(1->4)-alpha-D-glucan 1-alpha-D-glucosylmutase
MNRKHRAVLEAGPAPDRNDEYLLYQTLVGTFPEDTRHGTPEWASWLERVERYMEKAVKEAKVHTSWTSANAEYEDAVRRFTAAALGSADFIEDLAPFARRIAAAARLSSLALVALKLASPGVTDVYQGCELWDLSLVDPDNRRPVDYPLRARLVDELGRRAQADRIALARELGTPEGLRDGRAKLLLLREVLRRRRDDPALFLDGSYEPIDAEGPHAAHVVAFARRHGGRALICAVPRLTLRLLDEGGGHIAWGARLPLPEGLPREWTDAVTGEVRRGDALEARELFGSFPVAVLISGSRT